VVLAEDRSCSRGGQELHVLFPRRGNNSHRTSDLHSPRLDICTSIGLTNETGFEVCSGDSISWHSGGRQQQTYRSVLVHQQLLRLSARWKTMVSGLMERIREGMIVLVLAVVFGRMLPW
jgi:hypothetical protein